MKKLLQKRKNNKGFSLVELIVVVAIMAVLIGVLVPTLIKNVEKSRLSKDKNALDEVKNAVEVVLADEKYVDAACSNLELNGTDKEKVVLTGSVGDKVDADKFWEAVQENLGGKGTSTKPITLSSKLKDSASITITIAEGHCSIKSDSSTLKADYNFTIGE